MSQTYSRSRDAAKAARAKLGPDAEFSVQQVTTDFGPARYRWVAKDGTVEDVPVEELVFPEPTTEAPVVEPVAEPVVEAVAEPVTEAPVEKPVRKRRAKALAAINEFVEQETQEPVEPAVTEKAEKPVRKAKKAVKAKRRRGKVKVTKAVAKYIQPKGFRPKGSDDVRGKRLKLIKKVTSKYGATLNSLSNELQWQFHTVRGAISTAKSQGIIKNLKSYRDHNGRRVYKATKVRLANKAA